MTDTLHFSGFRLPADSNPPINNIPALMSSPSKRGQSFNRPPPLDGDEQIIKYIHKKFRSPTSSPCSDTSNKPVIKKVNISSPAPQASCAPCSVIQQRRSVIVRRGDNPVIPVSPPEPSPEKTTIEIEFMNIKSEDEELGDYGEDSVVTLSLNVLELENLFTHEERKYFGHSLSQFVGSWQEVHFGEEFMTMYTNFCQYRAMLPSKFISCISRAIRWAITLIYRIFNFNIT